MSIEVDPNWWKSMFDEIYLITDARTVGDDALTSREVSLLSELMPLASNNRILDLCGGHGRHALELSRRGLGRHTVLDFSHTLLHIGSRRAQKRGLPIAFVKGDARRLPLPPDSYHNVLILGNSLGYAGNGGADSMIIQEAYRVLKRGGSLLVDVTDGKAVRRHFTPNAWHEISQDMVVCRQRELNNNSISAREMVISKKNGLVRDKTYAIQLYSSEELLEIITQAGFSITSVHTDFSLYEIQGDLGFMNHRMIITAKKK